MSPTPPPVLSEGNHRDPAQGRCLMEHVSELAGEPFGELPRCTHPALAALAAQVNDRVSDAGRGRLATRAHRLAGATGRGDATLTWRLVAVCAGTVLARDPDADPDAAGSRDADADAAGRRTARRRLARATRAVRRGDRVRLPAWCALAVSLRPLAELTAAFHQVARVAGPPGSAARDDALVALLDAALTAAGAPPVPGPGADPSTITAPTTDSIREDCPA